MDETIIRTMRQQAWERAKGELKAMLATTWPGSETPPTRIDQFPKLVSKVKNFIVEIESDALQE